jgi:5-methyltetrahydrofolate--homocysteine methyltransferase
MLSDDIKKVSGLYEDWWKGTNKNALLNCRYFDNALYDQKLNKLKKDWMPDGSSWVLACAVDKALQTENTKYLTEALDIIEAYFECAGYAGAGYPSYFTNLGAGCLAAFITGYAKPYIDTVWFELDKPMDWETINKNTKAGMNAYGKMTLEAVRLVSDRLKDIAITSMLDLGGVVDVLASLRRTDALLYDVIDYTDEVEMSIKSIQNLWKIVHDDVLKIIEPANNGYHTSWMQMLSSKAYYPSQCDFSAMVSPAMVDELVLPSLEKEMGWFEKGVYHLDGPGELPHLDLLCSIKNLHAVQWVPMPFEPFHLEMHYPLYKKLIENGKKIIFTGYINDVGQIRKLFSIFPKEAFYMTISTSNREEAERIASLA